jgi:sigma-B regulation protein RsbU (phosphoserine phosphatase)
MNLPMSANESEAGPHVLVVDDALANRKVLTAILRKAGIGFEEARDGFEAIEAVARRKPDLVLLDVMMPGMDGYEVCRKIKADSATADVPVIFLSALSDASDRVRGLEAGAEDYVGKPFNPGEVLARVRTQLRLREMTESLRRLNRELLEWQARLREDLKAAGEVQRMLLPSAERRHELGGSAAWLFEPSVSVGGDILNVFPIGSDHVGIYVLDVSGHGVSAALVSASVAQALTPQFGIVATLGPSGTVPVPPEAVMAELERRYPLELFDKYFTLAYVLLDRRTGEVAYSFAGHPPGLLQRASGELELLSAGGGFVGLGLGIPFEEGKAVLAPGERIYLYSDGVTEHETAAHALFGIERLQQLLARDRSLPVEDVCGSVAAALATFGAGAPFRDDVSFLAFEFHGCRP